MSDQVNDFDDQVVEKATERLDIEQPGDEQPDTDIAMVGVSLDTEIRVVDIYVQSGDQILVAALAPTEARKLANTIRQCAWMAEL